jgi:hypothetical protein
VAVTPTQAAPTAGSFVTWDGRSGATRRHWSTKLEVEWSNYGKGDWLDSNQRPQGGTPFATANVSAVGPVTFDVVNLVRRWLTGAYNRGFYLSTQQSWALTFAGRAAANAASRPRLTVITDKGTFTPPCIGNAHWSSASLSTNNSQAAFRIAKDIWLAIVQFDLTGVSGTVRSASLVLNCQEMKYAGVVEIFEANPPGFRLGAGTEKVQQGLALSYPLDRNIEAHPKVLFASDFSDVSRARWHSGGAVTGSQQIVDPKTKSTYLRASIPKGQLWGCDLEHNVVGGTTEGTTNKVETELYARYYVYLEENWGSTVDANKMPGWDGRFGWWNSLGYWYPMTGNGGGRPSGKKIWNARLGRWVYEGSSMRGHGGTLAGDGNPYDSLFWLGGYIYHLDQFGDFGENVKWDRVAIKRGNWYCIEQYIKMNSISGPYDSVGNGQANFDGVYKAWVDGVPCYERSNFRWRRHPEMGIQGFWLNWYHGGKQATLSDMHFRMNSVVIAREYIGPRNDNA